MGDDFTEEELQLIATATEAWGLGHTEAERYDNGDWGIILHWQAPNGEMHIIRTRCPEPVSPTSLGAQFILLLQETVQLIDDAAK